MEYPTMIKPGCTAYFHIPPSWMGSAPSKLECERGPSSIFTEFVLKQTIIHGINVHVRRDGLVVFDCRAWTEAGETEVPAHVLASGKPVPEKVQHAEELGEERSVRRAQIINAHQACLCSALYEVRRRSQGIGAFVNPFQAYQFFRPDDPVPKWEHDVVQRFAAQLTDFGNPALRRSQVFQKRYVYELDVLERSFRLLDEIMRHPLPDLLVLTELLFRAGSQYSQNRFQESLVLSWGVCERFLNELWDGYIEAQVAQSVPGRIPGKRKAKLTSPEFTASIKSEALELSGQITTKMFSDLGAVRKARNDMMHKLDPVGEGVANLALRTAMELYVNVTGIKLWLNFGRHSSSGGAAPKEMLLRRDRIAASKPA